MSETKAARTRPKRVRVTTAVQALAADGLGMASLRAALTPSRDPVAAEAVALAARTRDRMAAIEAARQLGIEAVLRRAIEIAGRGLATDTVDLDWAGAFFAAAGQARDETLRDLWARMLVEEVRRPGCVSRRTIAVVRDLSPGDLALFGRFARFAVTNFAVRLTDEFLEGRGFSNDDLLYLEEIGLLRGQRDASKVFRSQREDTYVTHLLYGDAVLRVLNPDAKKTFTLPCHRLTRAGADVALLLRGEADAAYMMEIVRLAHKQGFKVMQATILQRSGPETVTRHTRFCEIVVYDKRRKPRVTTA